jgi:hypothetical protein
MIPNHGAGTIESLRVALHKLDYLSGPTPCQSGVAHARRAILLRLADAEAELAVIESLSPGNAETPQAHENAAWSLTVSIEEIEALEESAQKVPLHKLN